MADKRQINVKCLPFFYDIDNYKQKISKMFAYHEIKSFVSEFNLSKYSSDDETKLKDILHQLQFHWSECHCKSIIPSLYEKLVNWLKNHDKLSKYVMERGVLVWTNEGELVCATNISDELAEKVKKQKPQEFEKYIKQILPETPSEEETSTVAESMQEVSAELKAKKTTKIRAKSKK